MHLTADYVRPTPGRGRCRVRVFLPDELERDAPMVVCTELPDNPGQSVTNAAERIAAEVIANFRLPVPVIWIEHYEDGARGTEEDAHTFDLVIFSHYEPRKVLSAREGWSKKIGAPTWKALDRRAVEVLVGWPLD
ncbi:MAG TPA: hypothetical protein VKA51_05910 [Rubrobacteraceae bacterium]|nr:hypothetical protein [Rubrobacteraceae bacterium]